MAANILTILKDMIVNPDEESFKHALSYAPGCDNLDDQDWQQLEKLEGDKLWQKVADLYPKYYRLWRLYNKPATSEQWIETKWRLYLHNPDVLAEIVISCNGSTRRIGD